MPAYGKNNGFLIDRSNFESAEDINFAEASKLILLSMTTEDYGTSDPWYQKYLDKMSLYGFNNSSTDNLKKRLFRTHSKRYRSRPK